MFRTDAVVQFARAQKECGRMWHAMRYARLHLKELQARRFVSHKDIVEAHAMIKSTRALYNQALQRLFECETHLLQCP